MNEPTNEQRADHAYRHALIYAHEQNDDEDITAAITDLMVDLLHLCDQYGVEQTYAQRIALEHYRAETTDAVCA